jgi:hypothetical protein
MGILIAAAVLLEVAPPAAMSSSPIPDDVLAVRNAVARVLAIGFGLSSTVVMLEVTYYSTAEDKVSTGAFLIIR